MAAMAQADTDALQSLLAGMENRNADLDALLGTMPDVSDALAALMLEANAGLTDPDIVPDPPVKPVSRLGDLWLLGEHRVLCGDSTSAGDVARLMDGAKAECLFTDIPYGISQKSGGLRRLDYGEWDKSAELGLATISEVLESVIIKGSYYVFCSDLQLSVLLSFFESHAMQTRSFAWIKPNPTVINGQYLWLPAIELCAYGKPKKGKFNYNCERNIYEGTAPRKREHPTQKPVELIKKCINASTDKEDIVLDLFLGSGSTLMAAEQLNRKCYGMEISPQYVDVIINRWQAFTDKTATLESDGRSFEAVAKERE